MKKHTNESHDTVTRVLTKKTRIKMITNGMCKTTILYGHGYYTSIVINTHIVCVFLSTRLTCDTMRSWNFDIRPTLMLQQIALNEK
jgi:hypothetical protein